MESPHPNRLSSTKYFIDYKEEKRESKTADQVNRKLPPEIEEYLKQRESTVEVFQAVPPTLTPFYKKLVEKYFKSVN